jgi:chaperonin GroEL (HSP60 family)
MTKNVIHKSMPSSLSNARVLIFDCPLENDEYKIGSDFHGNQEIRR